MDKKEEERLLKQDKPENNKVNEKLKEENAKLRKEKLEEENAKLRKEKLEEENAKLREKIRSKNKNSILNFAIVISLITSSVGATWAVANKIFETKEEILLQKANIKQEKKVEAPEPKENLEPKKVEVSEPKENLVSKKYQILFWNYEHYSIEKVKEIFCLEQIISAEFKVDPDEKGISKYQVFITTKIGKEKLFEILSKKLKNWPELSPTEAKINDDNIIFSKR